MLMKSFFQVGNSLQDIPLHVIHLDQDDPRKCTSRKLAKHGGCFLHKSLTKSPKRGLLLDPLSGILIGPDDSTSIERGSSIVSLDCSWKEIEPSLAMLQRSTRLEGRTLPVVLAANPVSWGKPGRLSNVEAFAVCLTIFDRWEQAREIMKPFKFSEEFFSLNEQPLEAYSKAGTNAELAEIQWEFFDKPTED